MALEKTLVPVPFAAGIDRKTNPLLTAKLETLENGVYTRVAEIAKRNGYDALTTLDISGSSPLAMTSPVALAVSGDTMGTLVAFSTLQASVYSSTAGKWSSIGAAACCDVAKTTVVFGTGTTPFASNMDVTRAGNFSLFTWYQDSAIQYALFDEATKTFLWKKTMAGVSRAKVVTTSNGKIIVLRDNGSTTVTATLFDPASPADVAGSVTISSNGRLMDACAVFNGVLVAYFDNATAKIAVAGVTNALALGTGLNGMPAPTLFYVTAGLTSVALISVDNLNTTDAALFTTESAIGLKATVLNASTLAINVATTLVDATAGMSKVGALATGSSTFTAYWSIRGTPSIDTSYVKTASFTTSSLATTVSVFARQVLLCGKPFFVSLSHVPVVVASSTQSTYLVLRSDGAVATRLSPQIGDDPFLVSDLLPESTVTSTSVRLALVERGRALSGSGYLYTASNVVSFQLEFSPSRPFPHERLGPGLIVGGSLLSLFDGRCLSELGFHYAPEIVSKSTSTVGGSVPDGTFLYKAIFEWADALGQIHRSATSVAVSQTTSGGGTSTNTVVVSNLCVTAKPSNVAIALFRTAAGGTVYYLVSRTANVTTAFTTTFTDTTSDTTLQGNEILYTSGGVLDNYPGPATSVVAKSDDRLFAASAEDPSVVAYTKFFTSGEGPAFTGLMNLSIDFDGGPVTAIALMDDKTVIFKRDRFFVVVGSGPTDTGMQNGFSTPQRLPSDEGCVSAASVVLTPDGLLFQGPKGINLLTRGLEVKDLGAPVDALVAGTLIRAATTLDSKQQVRFLTDTGLCLVLNTFTGEWTTFANHTGFDACIWNRTYAYINAATSRVLVENATFADPSSTAIGLTVTTGWIATAGLQGFERLYEVQVFGTYRSAHTLRVSLAFDGESTFSQVTTFTPSVSDAQYQYAVKVARQKCESVKVKIEDLSSAGGEALTLTSLAFLVGAKKGAFRLPATRKSS